MIHNATMPKIDVDPETYEVKADRELLTCEPMAELPLEAIADLERQLGHVELIFVEGGDNLAAAFSPGVVAWVRRRLAEPRRELFEAASYVSPVKAHKLEHQVAK